MKIDTLSWGELEVGEDQLYDFSKGIPGFEQENRFALIAAEEGPFSYLQSLLTKELVFILADPFLFYSDYEFELPPSETEELAISEQLVVRCFITLQEQIEQSTINLLGPIVINPEKRLGKQVILHKSHYETRHSLWETTPQSTEEGV